MSKRSTPHPKTVRSKKTASVPSWSRILLALTLLPLISGALLIIAWALDFEIWEPQTQITIAMLLILISFALSNAVQKKWLLAAGWALLAAADFLILSPLDPFLKITGAVVGVIGVILLGVEFYRRFKAQQT